VTIPLYDATAAEVSRSHPGRDGSGRPGGDRIAPMGRTWLINGRRPIAERSLGRSRFRSLQSSRAPFPPPALAVIVPGETGDGAGGLESWLERAIDRPLADRGRDTT